MTVVRKISTNDYYRVNNKSFLFNLVVNPLKNKYLIAILLNLVCSF
ncbi:hypothetical protein EV202_10232 [Bacteroides heparinolyticus]|uniref:Uncharacterized protein n=1 Tax=Prevotella heparinolytica TaxID=28113 RepID=A0A4R2LWQ8_9BACE|nr:hypothetical protein EV202_10232 [Bacteroides heparinolyticus]